MLFLDVPRQTASKLPSPVANRPRSGVSPCELGVIDRVIASEATGRRQ
jgi:hypothetical protein